MIKTHTQQSTPQLLMLMFVSLQQPPLEQLVIHPQNHHHTAAPDNYREKFNFRSLREDVHRIDNEEVVVVVVAGMGE